MRKILSLVLASMLLLTLSVRADEVRYQTDDNFPTGAFSLANFRAHLRGTSQMDIGPLQPSAKRIVDPMEWSTNASAQDEYAGTGVTITSDSANEQEGTYSLKAVTDATANRTFGRSYVMNLSAYQTLTVWERSSQAADTIEFYVEDSSGNQSHWDITTNASADTWQMDTLDLTTPDSDNGTEADLSDIVEYGYLSLTSSKTYYFDTIKASVGMTVAVRGTNLGSYYRHVFLGTQPVSVDQQAAPTLVAPVTNPRIDILTVDSAGALAWVAGTENSSPVAPWTSVPGNVLPICEVYLKTTTTAILEYEDKDIDTNQGYILADVRPIFGKANVPIKGSDVASATTTTLGEGNFFDITGTTTITSITAKAAGTVVILQFDSVLTVTDGSNLKLNGNFVTAAGSVLQLVSDGTNWYEASRQPTAGDFISLSDTPSGYSGSGTRVVRVNSGETGLEFSTLDNAGIVDKTNNQTVNGVKTFGSFPVTPSSAPTTNYQVSNKKYVDDQIPIGVTAGIGAVKAVAIGYRDNQNNNDYQVVTFTEETDTDGMFTSNDSKMYAKTAGTYLAVCTSFQSTYNSSYTYENDTVITFGASHVVLGSDNGAGRSSAVAVKTMSVDEYVECYFKGTNAGFNLRFSLLQIY